MPPRASVEEGERSQMLSCLKSEKSILLRLDCFGCDKQACFPLIVNKNIMESGSSYLNICLFLEEAVLCTLPLLPYWVREVGPHPSVSVGSTYA